MKNTLSSHHSQSRHSNGSGSAVGKRRGVMDGDGKSIAIASCSGSPSTSATGIILSGSTNKSKADSIQADREAFLNAFEKPTQIYRYIRGIWLHNPVFLHRNLSYMKPRMSRTHTNRPNFKVDSMLGELEKKLNAEALMDSSKDTTKSYYNIILLGLTDMDHNWMPDAKAKVEIQIAKICLKKRKEKDVPIMKAFEAATEIQVQSSKSLGSNNNNSNSHSPTTSSWTNNHSNSSSTCPTNNTTNGNHQHHNHNNNSIVNHPTHPPNLCPVISVSRDCFNLINGHVVRSYVLVVRVSIPKSYLVKDGEDKVSKKQSSPALPETKPIVPPVKIPQTSRKLPQPSTTVVKVRKPSESITGPPVNSNARVITLSSTAYPNSQLDKLKPEDFNPTVCIKEEDQAVVVDEPRPKRRRSAPTRDREFIFPKLTTGNGSANGSVDGNGGVGDDIIYMGQVVIYDKPMNIALGAADYDLVLRQCQRRRASFSLTKLVAEESSWEMMDSSHPKVKNTPCGTAKLSIALRTSSVKVEQWIERPIPVNISPIPVNGCSKHSATKKKSYDPLNSKANAPSKVIYQFLYNNNSRQQTEAREDLRCPWCSLNCFTLYALLKHLKLCHPRFHFSYVPVPSGARIDVSINESYDGSYSGSAYDLIAQPPGEAFARNGPTKRTNIFTLLVCKHEKCVPSLNEFIESDEKDIDQRTAFMTGHNRLYHHTTTCLPIQPKEIEIDSEGEQDPEWLQIKTKMMIDDFSDVNEGEKEVMKMWNLHVLKHNYVGDCQIPLALEKFIEYQGKELIRKNLYRNFILHLTSLFDFGILTPEKFYHTVQLLQLLIKETNTASSLRDSWIKSSAPHKGSKPGSLLPALTNSPTKTLPASDSTIFSISKFHNVQKQFTAGSANSNSRSTVTTIIPTNSSTSATPTAT